ncbi:MAG: c-type cytochrome [Gammaproteobacteria bacterium]|nr:c-type cytochrome [Gammaproteobacteria bacterium]
MFKLNKTLSSLAIASLLISVGGTASAADAAAGKAKAAVCAACHGPAGISMIPTYPNLAGQKEAYLAAQSKAIKSGARTGGMTAVMKPVVANISDADLDDIAAYYAGLK